MRHARGASRRAVAGYTLTELLMVVAIVGTMSAVAPQILVNVTRFFRQNQARSEIHQEARAAFDIMARNVRQAKASTIVIDQATGEPAYSRIEFTKMDGKWFKYYQGGSKLYQVTTSTKTLSSNVRYLSFTNPRTDNDNLISVTLTLEKATYNAQVKTLQLSVQKIRVQND